MSSRMNENRGVQGGVPQNREARMTRRAFVATAGLATAASAALGACARPEAEPEEPPAPAEPEAPERDNDKYADLAIDPGAWKYDEANDCYYQLGLTYCLEPGSKAYESLAIFVPGAYFAGEKSGNTYKCTIQEGATVGGFTPGTAPVVMPINSAKLQGQTCPTAYSYEGLARYMEAGFVYVYAGFRGRSGGFESDSKKMFHGGAPWPVVDMKAAIRYLRFNADQLPIDASRVFTFGYGAGGGLSALAGATGDAEMYDAYLDSIGAARWNTEGEDLSDATFGSASWCPITSFDTADSAYEWMMGQWSRTGARAEGEWTRLLSADLAATYGEYVNGMDFTAGDDHLVLDAVEDGSYVSGPYYDHMMGVVEDAAATFFSTTQFPYTVTPTTMSDPQFPGDPNLAANADVEAAAGAVGDDSAAADAVAAGAVAGVSQVQSTVYDNVESYINSLNGDERWLTYSASRGAVSITGLWDFVQHCRPADKGVGAFDAIDRSTEANQLFGIDDESTLHFDATIARLVDENQERYAAPLAATLAAKVAAGEELPVIEPRDAKDADGSDTDASGDADAADASADGEKNADDAAAGAADSDATADDTVEGTDDEAAEEAKNPATPEETAAAMMANYALDWSEDLGKQDALEATMAVRVDAMNPLYFLSGASEGFGSSTVASHWRINAGLFQTGVAMTSEMNLALALGAHAGVEDVQFDEVWGKGYELAERSGNAQDNFVAWVVSCCPDAAEA